MLLDEAEETMIWGVMIPYSGMTCISKSSLELDSGTFALDMPFSVLELLVVALETPVSELELSISVLVLLVSV